MIVSIKCARTPILITEMSDQAYDKVAFNTTGLVWEKVDEGLCGYLDALVGRHLWYQVLYQALEGM